MAGGLHGELQEDLELGLALSRIEGRSETSDGLAEVADPSKAFLSDWESSVPGTIAFPAVEGRRSVLLEIQALTNSSDHPQPRRSVRGVEASRVHQILAVLNRHGEVSAAGHDVYVNVVGGWRISEPGCDLPIALAVASSLLDVPLGPVAAWGEVGLAGEVRQVAYVPDAGHSHLITLCAGDAAMRSVPLTTEEEGVALLAGAWLGGERGALLMQSSGVGNCVNMLSLTQACRFPLLMLITMRGEWGEFNPWQVQMGQGTQQVLEAVGVNCFPVDRAEEVGETFEAAADMAFNGGLSCAVLVSQRIIGAKGFGR